MVMRLETVETKIKIRILTWHARSSVILGDFFFFSIPQKSRRSISKQKLIIMEIAENNKKKKIKTCFIGLFALTAIFCYLEKKYFNTSFLFKRDGVALNCESKAH